MNISGFLETVPSYLEIRLNHDGTISNLRKDLCANKRVCHLVDNDLQLDIPAGWQGEKILPISEYIIN